MKGQTLPSSKEPGIWPQHSCFTPSPSHLLPSLKSLWFWSFSSSWSIYCQARNPDWCTHTHTHPTQTQLFKALLPDIGGHHLFLLRKRMLCLCKSCLTIKQTSRFKITLQHFRVKGQSKTVHCGRGEKMSTEWLFLNNEVKKYLWRYTLTIQQEGLG